MKIEIPAFLQGDVKKGGNPSAGFSLFLSLFPTGMEPRLGQVSMPPASPLLNLSPHCSQKELSNTQTMSLKALNPSSYKIKPKFSSVAFEGEQNMLPPNMPLWNKDYFECKATENRSLPSPYLPKNRA